MLDTNICIFTIKNKPQIVREAFNRHKRQLCICGDADGVLLRRRKIGGSRKEFAVIEGFVARLEVLPFDNEAAAHTGMIRSELAKAGTPIGPYDHIIAGHARSRGLSWSPTTYENLNGSQVYA